MFEVNAVDPPSGDESQVFVEFLKTLVRLSTSEQLALMEAWYRRQHDELGPDHNT
jgi:hypothetical protein